MRFRISVSVDWDMKKTDLADFEQERQLLSRKIAELITGSGSDPKENLLQARRLFRSACSLMPKKQQIPLMVYLSTCLKDLGKNAEALKYSSWL